MDLIQTETYSYAGLSMIVKDIQKLIREINLKGKEEDKMDETTFMTAEDNLKLSLDTFKEQCENLGFDFETQLSEVLYNEFDLDIE